MANLPSGTSWGATEIGSGYVPASDIAKKMLAEREFINSKTKLTWSKDAPPRYPTDRMIGKVNLSAPFIRFGTGSPGKYYYLQNCEFFLGNGEPTTLEHIAELEALAPFGAITIETLKKAEAIFLADAAKRDPNLCKHCLHYRARDNDDYLKHIMTIHPDVAMSLAGIETAPAPKVDVPVKGSADFTYDGFECCGKQFKNQHALLAHRRFSKTSHGA